MHKSLARFKKMKKIVSVAIRKMWLFARQSQELVMFEGYWSSLQLWFQEGYYVILCTQCMAWIEWKERVIYFSTGLFENVLGAVPVPSWCSNTLNWGCRGLTHLFYLSWCCLTFPLVTCNLSRMARAAKNSQWCWDFGEAAWWGVLKLYHFFLHLVAWMVSLWSMISAPLLQFSCKTCSAQSCGNCIGIVPWSCDVCHCSVYEIFTYFGSVRINTLLLPSFFLLV